MIGRLRGYAIAAGVFVGDQLAKYIVTYPLALQERGTIELNPIFQLNWVQNHGVSFGMLTANSATARWLLVALTGVIAIGVATWLWRERRGDDVAALGLILGGALGNIVDRARFGYVVDYADLHFGEFRPFMVFNAADAAISLGVLLLLARGLFARDKTKVTEHA